MLWTNHTIKFKILVIEVSNWKKRIMSRFQQTFIVLLTEIYSKLFVLQIFTLLQQKYYAIIVYFLLKKYFSI